MTVRAWRLLNRVESVLLPICPREQRDTPSPYTTLPSVSPLYLPSELSLFS